MSQRTLKLAVGAIAATLLGTSAASAAPLLILDLVKGGTTSTKSTTISGSGATVQMDLLAKVLNNDANAANDGMLQVQGAVADTGTATIAGSLSSTLIAPFNDSTTAKNGTTGANASGSPLVTDVGVAPNGSTGFYIPSSGSAANFADAIGNETIGGLSYKVWRLGSITFAATAALADGQQTDVNFVPRNSTLFNSFNFTTDGSNKALKFASIAAGDVQIGSAFTIATETAATPEPATLAALAGVGLIGLRRRRSAR